MKLILTLVMLVISLNASAKMMTVGGCIDVAALVQSMAKARDTGITKEYSITLLAEHQENFKSLVDVVYDNPNLTPANLHELTLKSCLKD